MRETVDVGKVLMWALVVVLAVNALVGGWGAYEAHYANRLLDGRTPLFKELRDEHAEILKRCAP